MAEKPLDRIIGKPATESMNIMTEQMGRMVAAVKTTVGGGKHESLALVLNKYDYRNVTREAGVKLTRSQIQHR